MHSRNDEETVVEAITPCYPSDQKDTGAKGGDERQIGLSSRLGLFSVTGDSTSLNNEAQNNLSTKACLSFITSVALTVNQLLSF